MLIFSLLYNLALCFHLVLPQNDFFVFPSRILFNFQTACHLVSFVRLPVVFVGLCWVSGFTFSLRWTSFLFCCKETTFFYIFFWKRVLLCVAACVGSLLGPIAGEAHLTLFCFPVCFARSTTWHGAIVYQKFCTAPERTFLQVSFPVLHQGVALICNKMKNRRRPFISLHFFLFLLRLPCIVSTIRHNFIYTQTDWILHAARWYVAYCKSTNFHKLRFFWVCTY